MSAYNEILVLRADSGWAELPHLKDVAADPTHRTQELPGGWMVVTSSDCAPEADWLPSLAQATGSPVMWCTVTAMDSTYVRGLSQAGAWAGWLNTGGVDEELAGARFEELDVEELLDEGGQDAIDEATARLGAEVMDEILAAAPALAVRMGHWAHDAGHDVDVEAVRALLVTGDAFGSRHLNDLLVLLRLTGDRVL